MPQLVMYWDGVNALGDSTAGLEIHNAGGNFIEIPYDACGFRLGIPNQTWSGSWYFSS